MPRQYRNRMTLNTVGYEPTVFNPIEFKPVEDDYNILARSFAQQEERQEKATQQKNIIKQSLGKAREQLHQDPDTLMWFDQKAKDIENSINGAAAVGDYSGALIAGVDAAGDLANDASLNARIRSNAQYKEEFERQRERIGKGISQATFDWWVKNNPYHYEDIKDGNGVVIGGNDWKSDFTPVDDIDSAQLALTAFKLLSPEKKTTNNTSNLKNKTEYSDLTRVDNSSYERITRDDILANIEAIIGPNVDNWRAIRQGFNVALNEADKLKSEYESLDPNSDEYKLKKRQYEDQMAYFKGENNQTLTNDENGWKIYYSKLITDNMFARGLAYDWKTTDTRRIMEDPSKHTGTGGSTGGNNYPQAGGTPKKEYSEGNRTVKQQKTQDAVQGATSAGAAAATQFKN